MDENFYNSQQYWRSFVPTFDCFIGKRRFLPLPIGDGLFIEKQ